MCALLGLQGAWSWDHAERKPSLWRLDGYEKHPEVTDVGSESDQLQECGAQGRVFLIEASGSPCNTGDTGDAGSIPGLGRSPGGGNGNPLHYSCLENPMDRGVWFSPGNKLSLEPLLKPCIFLPCSLCPHCSISPLRPL